MSDCSKPGDVAFASYRQGSRRRSLALYFLCVGVLMIVLDATIVAVALPSILTDMHLSGSSLVWMLNSYTLSFGGFLLLSGRLGDLYGQRRLFLAGIIAFTLASLACGLTYTQGALIAARVVQGLAGAVVTAVSLPLILSLFSEPADRARALGIYGFICAAGGSAGEILGGLVTKVLNWHWIFLINLPIGAVVYAFCASSLPPDANLRERPRLDVAGAFFITSALTLGVYALTVANEPGWAPIQTQGLLGTTALLLVLFVITERSVREPLMPFGLFRHRNFNTANALGVLWSGGTSAWFALTTLYLQYVLNYNPLQVGVAFMPETLLVAAFSWGLSAKIITRFGVRGPLCCGFLLAASGLGLFSRVPVHASFVVDVLPGMLLIGIGAGMVSAPLLLAAINDVDKKDSGVASGMLNTSFLTGGTLGLAALVGLAGGHTEQLQQAGDTAVDALVGGYRFAFLVGGMLAGSAAVLGALMLRPRAHLEKVASTPASTAG
jgi:EmrB/QacA subfamily drug resistance transporter